MWACGVMWGISTTLANGVLGGEWRVGKEGAHGVVAGVPASPNKCVPASGVVCGV